MSLLTQKTDPTTIIPNAGSNSAAWVEWHKTLLDSFGKKVANAEWLKAWNLRGSTSVSDNTLREYMKKQGITLPATWGQSIEDAGVGVVDEVLGIFHMEKTVGIVVGLVILVPVAILLINLARKPEKIGAIVGTAAKVAV
jgi:hypothetical protein